MLTYLYISSTVLMLIGSRNAYITLPSTSTDSRSPSHVGLAASQTRSAEFLPKLALYYPDEIVKELVSQFIVAECSGCPAMLKRGAMRTDPASE